MLTIVTQTFQPILGRVKLLMIGLVVLSCQNAKEEQKADIKNSSKKIATLAELQLRYVNTRYQAYFHYGMNSFEDGFPKEHKDWGSGRVDPKFWIPTGLDCEQWAKTVIEAGMRGGCLTTKHHDGFNLWDSKVPDPTDTSKETTYDIGASRVKVDVVQEFVDAFRANGLQIGLYYSIWDFHYEVFGDQVTANKKAYILGQIRELLTNYGKIDYINFDGWQKYSGGGRGKVPYYGDDIPYYEVYNLVKSLQPECLIINHQYETNLAHSDVPFADAADNKGYPYEKRYMRPTAASDVLQNFWFWDDTIKVKQSANDILKKLEAYNSYNSVYTLNIAPNREGRINQEAIDSLKVIKAMWKRPSDLNVAPENWGYDYDVAENIAFMKPVKQSSTGDKVRDARARPLPEIALDGILEGNGAMEQTSMTLEEDNPWWQVNLGTMYDIDVIEIFNRTDTNQNGLQNFDIILLDAEKHKVWSKRYTSAPRPNLKIEAIATGAQYVKIQLNNKSILNLAEVIVKENR